MPNTLPKRHVPVTASTIGTSSSSRPKESSKSSSEAAACNCSFQLISKIGQGGYGSVYLVEKNEGLDQKAIYAMKVVNKKTVLKKPKEVEYIKTERYIMSEMRHPFIIGLNYAFQTSTELFFIMDLASGGEVFNQLEKYGAFDESTAKFYICEVLCALSYLHSHNIVYRDLKPDNILINNQGHVKLADFGLSKIFHHSDNDNTIAANENGVLMENCSLGTDIGGNIGCKFTSYHHGSIDDPISQRMRSSTRSCCGTLVYMAPEVIEKTPYGKAADFWSMGVVIYDMLVGTPPFHVEMNKDFPSSSVSGGGKKQKADCHRSNTNRSATKYNILHCNYRIPEYISKSSTSLIQNLLKLDVENRLGGYDADLYAVRAHPFFENICWEQVEASLLSPPYIPSLDGPMDVSHFDEKHTNDKKAVGTNISAKFDFQQQHNPTIHMDHPVQSSTTDTEFHINDFDYVLPGLTGNGSNSSLKNSGKI